MGLLRSIGIGVSALAATFVSAAAGAPEATQLPGGGEIVSRVEKQEFNPVCRAERTYPEFRKFSSAQAQEKLNRAARRILSVGKKLQAKDCPDPKFHEDYTYINRYSAGGTHGDLLGMRFTVLFPGGSGRVLNDCRIFDLKTGDELKLARSLKPGAAQEIQALFPEAGEKLDWYSGKKSVSPFCLAEEGLLVLKTIDGKFYGEHVVLSRDQIARFFEPQVAKRLNAE